MRQTQPQRARQQARQRALVFHFLGLGGGLFVLTRLAAAPSPEPVVVTAAQVEALSASFEQRHGRQPSNKETRGVVDRFVREELLVREARRRGLEDGDLLIRRRLLEKMALLDPAAVEDLEASYRQALELGLGSDDVIIRRRLVQVMERVAKHEAGPVRIHPEDERRYYDEHRGDFERPARYAFRHVFVARSRQPGGSDRARPRAERLLAELRSGSASAAGLGDPFLLGLEVPLSTAAEIAEAFGPDFARALTDLPEQSWSPPVESSYGWHLVWLAATRPASPRPFEEVQTVIASALRTAEEKRRVESLVATLRGAQPVRLEMPLEKIQVAEVAS